jgi:CubicO group peptidase (beta-lactamase class C family)
MITVNGTTEDGFEPVADAFVGNFRTRTDLGAACAVYHRGKPVVDVWGGHRDVVVKIRNEYSVGYSRPYSDFAFGRSNAAFGTSGVGGTFGFADPAAELAFAYVPNRLGVHLVDDSREVAVREAVYECL